MTRRLAEVARQVGVSEATVSRVLNGRSGVSAATRAAVLTALDVMGYERPTQLRGERARLVGLVLPELQNPIFPAFAEVVGGALAQQGFTPVLCTQTAGGGVSEADYVDLLLQQQVSGVVFAGGNYALQAAPHAHYQLPPGATRAAGRAGLSVPGDVSIVGYDDSAFMSCTDPPLTTVRQPIESMGRAAIDLLVSLIEGATGTPDELLFEPELVVRASTA